VFRFPAKPSIPSPFEVLILSEQGIPKDEQYCFWGVLFTSLGLYARYTYKVHLLKKYVKETHPDLKGIIGGQFPFTDVELKGADLFIKHYGKNPRYFLLLPLAFISAEGIIWGYQRFWRKK
jgi:hypothetical protein